MGNITTTKEKKPPSNEKLSLRIGGMQCSFCVESIKKAYQNQQGVIKSGVNLAHEEAIIEYDSTLTDETTLKDTIRSMGFTIKDKDQLKSLEDEQKELHNHKSKLINSGVVAISSLLLMILMWTGFQSTWFKWIMLAAALYMIFGVGLFILKMAFQSFKRGILNQHVLMEFGALGGLIGGVIGIVFQLPSWPTPDFLGAAIFITAYHILSGYTSLLVRSKTSQAVTELLRLQPNTARKLEGSEEIEVPTDEVQIGDKIKILPGESIPLDGKITEGSSVVDESIVTGEPIGRLKEKNDQVIGGSINQNSALIIEVTATSDDSFLQRVVRSIEEARSLKPGILQMVEKVLKYFVPGVLIIAASSFVFWSLGWSIITGSPDFYRAYFATLAVLVMGYPCALGMATPLAMIKGGGEAAQNGILLKSSSAFQIIDDLQIIAFDKTGTITNGNPEVTKIYSPGNNRKDMVILAASLEKSSEHPLGKAIVNYARSVGLDKELLLISHFESISGMGVKGEIEGHQILVGNPRFILEHDIDLSPVEVKIKEFENKGWTTIVTTRDSEVLGIFGISDTIKEDAKQTISQLHNLGFQTVLITGDNKVTARQVADQVGIPDVRAEILPDEKAELIRELQGGGKVVAMVGDGINDGPALMQANIGIAFGSGTDIAIEATDIVVMRSQVSSLLDVYEIGRISYRKTKQNVALAFSFNGIGVPLAATGLIHPVFAMIAMAASVTVVLANSYSRDLFNTDFRTKFEDNKTHTEHVVGNEEAEDEKSSKSSDDQISTTIKVPTIHCQGCVTKLIETLTANSGIDEVTGDSDRKFLEIEYDRSKIDYEKIIRLIEEANHSVSK